MNVLITAEPPIPIQKYKREIHKVSIPYNIIRP